MPCRAEFGVFQRVSVARGREVAFIGIDSGDSEPRRATTFLRSFPVSYPSYYDRSGAGRRGDHRLDASRRSPSSTTAAAASTSARVPTRARPSSNETSGATRWAGERMPELRIDPLSGHRTIVAGERSRRPGGEPALRSRPSRSIPSATRSPRATRTARRRSSTRCAPAAGRADSPGWTVRVVPNLYPALEPRAPGAAPQPEPGERRPRSARAVRSLPATGAHEVIINGPQPVLSLAELPVEQVVAAIEVWRERMRAHARQRLRAADRQRAPRGGRLAAAHPRAALRAGLRAGGRRARARARRRLHDAHDGPEPARRPGRGGGAPRRADRGDRRRGGADGAVRLAAALPADARAARAAAALRGRRRRPARRCCTTGCAGCRATSARARR